jgi:cell division protease FtsH
MTKEELNDRICVMLGGRAAEEIACSDISTGAQNDLERASETARQMICRFGMSDVLGPVTFGDPGGPSFLEGPVSIGEKNYSEATAQLIDAEVRKIVDAQRERALAILRRRHPALDTLVQRLLVEETLEREALDDILVKSLEKAAE